MQLHVRDSRLRFMQQVRRQICSQLGDGEFLPRYFECAEWACMRKVWLSVARPRSGYVSWACVKNLTALAKVGALTNTDSRLTLGAQEVLM